ncbi:non-ribosomal peptide synthetase, partial [Paenibacillus terrae]|uniref:non-ribosomal peptide synthetase n=1 Tax=Paenibacillus terrae TaxID=159743 RepID=UPI0011EB8E50
MLNKENVKDIYTLSPMQKGMFFHSLKERTTAYFEQMDFTIIGQLKISHLEASFNDVLKKYDVLRTVFLHKGLNQPMQVVLKEREAEVHYRDISHLSGVETSSYVEKFKQEDRERGFDLSKDLLIRLSVLQEGADTYHLIWSFHHILFDGWCLGFIVNDFFQSYSRHYDGLPVTIEKKPSYSEYIRWLEKQNTEKARLYWKSYLEGYGQLTGIPDLNSVHKPVEQNFTKVLHSFDAELTDRLVELAKKHHVTLNNVFETLWGLLLHKYNQTSDAVFGSVVNGRPSAIPGIEHMVGLFINTVPVRVQSHDKDRFSEVLKRVHEGTLSSKDYEYISLADIQTDSGFTGPLLNHIMVFVNYPTVTEGAEHQHFKIQNVKTFEQTNYSLNVVIEPGDEITIVMEYDRALYADETIAQIFRHLHHLATTAVDHPEAEVQEFYRLADVEQQQLLNSFQGKCMPYAADKTIPQLFEEQVERTPDVAAVSFEDMSVTYVELNERVNRLARYLISRGIQREQLVGIAVERSLDMIVGVLAILKAGGAYLPIDPEYPHERIRYLLQDSGAEYLLTHKGLHSAFAYEGQIIELDHIGSYAADNTNPPHINLGSDLAYVIYTSGSTGEPKGVMIEHQALHNLHLSAGAYAIEKGSQVLQFASLSFDASVGDIFHTLLTGATLHLIRKEQLLAGHQFTEWLHTREITSIPFIPPTVLKQLSYAELPKLKVISTGGEALPAELVRTWGTDRVFLNAYGPTETTVDATIGHCTASMSKPPIGMPTINKRVYILDAFGNLQPIGVPGEMYIGGAGVARGYLHRSELTAERFLDDPFLKNGRMYKTGDLARWLPDGNIEFMGRIDDQVKIRGFRIELGEIESRLIQAPSVTQAVVAVQQGTQEQNFLCAYVVTEGSMNPSTLRSFVGSVLPEYMVPSFFVQIDQIPLLPSGKIDRSALPMPDFQTLERSYVAPSSLTEQMLVSIWQSVLGIQRIGVEDHFFELGGHSLKAMMLASRVYKELQVEIPLRDIFRLTTIKQMAHYIDHTENREYSPIPVAPEQAYYPVSSVQKRMYVIQQMEDEGSETSYNMPSFYKLCGRVHIPKLKEALAKLVQRHESLRTSFHMLNGELLQKIHPEIQWSADFAHGVGMEGLSPELIQESFIRPFALHEAPLFRATIVPLGQDEHVLMMDMHHIISDGISSAILLEDLSLLYRDELVKEPSKTVKDYVMWLESEPDRQKNNESYWLKQFVGELPVLELPTDYLRPPVHSFEGEYITYTLNESVCSSVRAYMKRRRVTLYTVLLSVYDILLHKYTNQNDIIVGVPVSDRPHPDVQRTVGMFVNTLAVRNRLEADQTFSSFLETVNLQVLDMYEHQDYPLEELVDKLNIQRDISRNPLFDTMFGVQNIEVSEFQFGDAIVEALNIPWNNSKFDMSWTVIDDELLHIGVEFSTALFKEETVLRMMRQFEWILEQVVTQDEIRISQLKLLTPTETDKMLHTFNNTTAAYPQEQTLHHLFEEHAERHPERTAIVMGAEHLTYGELNVRANRLAYTLLRRGVQPDQLVGLITERSPEMIVAILAIFKAGGAYLPIDPSYPADRIRHMLADSGTALLLVQQPGLLPADCGYAGEIIDLSAAPERDEAGHNPITQTKAEHLAYVMYTSGSTGQPKGVMTTHRNVVKTI